MQVQLDRDDYEKQLWVAVTLGRLQENKDANLGDVELIRDKIYETPDSRFNEGENELGVEELENHLEELQLFGITRYRPDIQRSTLPKTSTSIRNS
ncbi:hypothetical protein U3A55_04850 [Salarchaeum sp. III]|uniref:hypothetical protein n=1 Tax=Salarchaeum sp. III TaxID=3107927 RepID=UPI002ED9BD92